MKAKIFVSFTDVFQPKKVPGLRHPALSRQLRAMVISWDNGPKHRKTGGKGKPCHKKKKIGAGTLAANGKIAPAPSHPVCVRGRSRKY